MYPHSDGRCSDNLWRGAAARTDRAPTATHAPSLASWYRLRAGDVPNLDALLEIIKIIINAL